MVGMASQVRRRAQPIRGGAMVGRERGQRLWRVRSQQKPSLMGRESERDSWEQPTVVGEDTSEI